jgi:short-subunit dehydrogenase
MWVAPEVRDPVLMHAPTRKSVACFGAFLYGREAAKRMVARGRGTILFMGATASLRGSANFAAFSGAKHALRALAQSMVRELVRSISTLPMSWSAALSTPSSFARTSRTATRPAARTASSDRNTSPTTTDISVRNQAMPGLTNSPCARGENAGRRMRTRR